MAVCPACAQEMAAGVGCTLLVYDGEKSARLFNGSQPCRDCRTPDGALHHPGCDAERCPACGGQAISCPCGSPVDT